MEEIKRTHHCGEITLNDEGKTVDIVGWVSKKRNLGSLLFIDLRDRYGIVQVLVKTDEVELEDIKNEYILSVHGVVAKKDVPNKALKTGEIEVIAEKITVINKAEQPPIIISDNTDASEDVRLKYRYLDLRRHCVLDRFLTRAKIVKSVHEYLDANDFIEVETPILTLSTPEGARDYLVPSRIHKGCFYALPQSPQLFKQLLMVGGFERYYQVAKCFRDEDLRADRQPDFTQIDIECSFLNENQILTMTEGLIHKIFKDVINYDVELPLRRISYDDAVNIYGSDKPDTRFDLKLNDIKYIFNDCAFEQFKENKYVFGIKVDDFAQKLSRKEQDRLNLTAQKFNLKNFHYFKYSNNELSGSLLKFLNDNEKELLIKQFDLKENDAILVATSNYKRDVCFALGAIRTQLAKELNLIDNSKFDLLWVVDFPLFDRDEKTNVISPCHHPFTQPQEDNLDLLETEPYKVKAHAYDIVINGYEAGGGSLRIYDQNLQKRIFKALGFTEEDIKNKFGFFVEALKYGTPPHGGLAFGLDRLTMILSGTDNIRDVIAFPKNLSAVCPMSNAPQHVDDSQLRDLHIKISEE